mmetsp:Transcript_22751/g.40256  ORF Transcript_22751/g.40256 Transcript_22751/m.40256 type:complete len:268 (+) Transcript_22751:96-899(+)|eukprot:CAMPEP_0197526694 /NCGR_PEP_ID=MMETSP1318-20131121/18913_1 /TAXON_ID=552666 /ORGANISM="Partenskyella glossopodia, Strain RCC365" /LENGTH=267 /DNA_ID=CAMNT_0043080979 /DNA_START=38 /DNA_END=841 /DNA_ORIENTATION=-
MQYRAKNDKRCKRNSGILVLGFIAALCIWLQVMVAQALAASPAGGAGLAAMGVRIEGFGAKSVPIVPRTSVSFQQNKRPWMRSLRLRRQAFDGPEPKMRPAPVPAEKYPVMKRIAGHTWEGKMLYASGSELTPAPFKLNGATRCYLDGRMCILDTLVTLPNGKTRRLLMSGNTSTVDNDFTVKLEPVDDKGPISLFISEVPPDTLLIHEVEKATGKVVLAGSMTIVADGEEIVQVSHEIENGKPQGAQIWKMVKNDMYGFSEDDEDE